jgi:hypothetical protein
VKQHIRSGGNLFGRGVFRFVVTESVFAGNKNHACRGNTVDLTGIMSRTGNDVEMTVSKGFGRIPDF